MSSFVKFNEINYFCTTHTTFVAVEEKKKKFEAIATIVKEKLDGSIDLGNRRYDSAKDSLAFLVEATVQLHPREWSVMLNLLSEKIKQTPKNEDVKWLLFQSIRDAYTASLTLKMKQAEKAGDKQEMENLDTLMGLYTLLHGETEENYKNGMTITYGGVHRVYLPEWYKNQYIG